MDNTTTMDYKITTFDADRYRNIKLSSVLKLQQEIGEEHLERCGLPYNTLYEQGMVFILSRARMLFHRPPQLLEKVRLTTWSRGTKRMLFHRCYSFADASGCPLIDSQTAFVLLDPQSRRMRRPSDFDRLYDRHLPERKNRCPEPEKLRIQKEGMAFSGTRRVVFSDIDYNGHMNNAVYADLVCDFLPGGMEEKRPRELQIHFVKEALLGDRLAVYTREWENGADFWAGKEDETVFTARIVFEKNA